MRLDAAQTAQCDFGAISFERKEATLINEEKKFPE